MVSCQENPLLTTQLQQAYLATNNKIKYIDINYFNKDDLRNIDISLTIIVSEYWHTSKI